MADLANAHLIYAMLREEQIAAEFSAALERKFLDEKFFYWLPPSVAAWCDLCNAPAYRNANRALNLLRREAPRLTQIARNAAAICGLGCGEGSKDEIILQAFAAQKRSAGYVAADFSQALIERALDRCVAYATKQIGVKLDVFREEHLAQLAKLAQQNADGSIIYAVLGNTFGAFDPHDFPPRLWNQGFSPLRVLFVPAKCVPRGLNQPAVGSSGEGFAAGAVRSAPRRAERSGATSSDQFAEVSVVGTGTFLVGVLSGTTVSPSPLVRDR